MGDILMLRKSMMAIACLLAASPSAWAADDAPASPAASADAKPVTVMEQPLPGDFWTYEAHDEISGKVTAVRTQLITEVSPT